MSVLSNVNLSQVIDQDTSSEVNSQEFDGDYLPIAPILHRDHNVQWR